MRDIIEARLRGALPCYVYAFSVVIAGVIDTLRQARRRLRASKRVMLPYVIAVYTVMAE